MLVNEQIPVRAHQLHSLRMALICVAGALLASLLFTMEHTFVHVTVIMMAAGVVFSVAYRWFQGQLDWFEPIHIVGLIYFVFFGLGSIWLVNDPVVIGYDRYLAQYVPRAAFYCLLGQWAMLMGYFGPLYPRGQVRRTPEWPRGWAFVGLVAGIGFVGFLASAMVERSFHVGSRLLASLSPVAQLSPLFFFAWGLGWLLYYSGRATRLHRWVLFGGLAPAAFLVVYLTVSDKSLVMTMLGIPIIARWYGLRRIPWGVLLALLLILVFVVFPLYNTFRWSDPHAGNAERLQVTYSKLQTWGTDTYLRFSLDAFKFRVALINSVAVIVRDTGRWVPFAKGGTIFLPTMTYLIPRYLWPDKPLAEPGREFGRRFRVTNYWSRDTSIAATIPGELYWNFHVPGIVIGMALFGFAMRWLYRIYGEGKEMDPVRLAVHILILIQLAHFGGSIAIDAVILLRMVVILAVVRWLGRRFDLLGSAPEPTSDAVA